MQSPSSNHPPTVLAITDFSRISVMIHIQVGPAIESKSGGINQNNLIGMITRKLICVFSVFHSPNSIHEAKSHKYNITGGRMFHLSFASLGLYDDVY
jgi:hypothetical protein